MPVCGGNDEGTARKAAWRLTGACPEVNEIALMPPDSVKRLSRQANKCTMLVHQFAFPECRRPRPLPAFDSPSQSRSFVREGGLHLKEFVSSQWTSVAVLVASMSVVCAIFVPYGFPWTGLAWASLALLAAALMAMRSTRSIRQVIDDVETEAKPATWQERVPMPIGGAQLGVEGEATP